MEREPGMFDVKLQELEEAYARLQSRIRMCQGQPPGQLRGVLVQVEAERRAHRARLEQTVRAGRLPAAAALARAQLSYEREADQLLRRELACGPEQTGAPGVEDRSEAAALYAEYAIDFATQATQYALDAALRALDLQMGAAEDTEDASIRRQTSDE